MIEVNFTEYRAMELSALPVFNKSWQIKFFNFISSPIRRKDKDGRVIFREQELQRHFQCPRSTANNKIRELLDGKVIIRHPSMPATFILNNETWT